MTCNGDLDHGSAQLSSSALSLLVGYTVPSGLLMARYDPVKECAQDRTGYVSCLYLSARARVAQQAPRRSQGISSVGSTTCVGDADITYPVASRNSPPVDGRCVVRRSMAFLGSIKLFRSWPSGHQAGDPFSSSSSSGQFDSTSSLAPSSRGHHHHHRSYVPYPISSTYGFNNFLSAMGALNCMSSQ